MSENLFCFVLFCFVFVLFSFLLLNGNVMVHCVLGGMRELSYSSERERTEIRKKEKDQKIIKS